MASVQNLTERRKSLGEGYFTCVRPYTDTSNEMRPFYNDLKTKLHYTYVHPCHKCT